MAASQAHEDVRDIYKGLDKMYRIKARRGFVECVYLGRPSTSQIEPKVGTDLSQEEINNILPEPSLGPPPPEAIHLPRLTSLLEAIGAAVKLGDKTDEIFFPDMYLEDEDRLKLYKWCQQKGWKYIDHEGAGITLTRRDVDEMVLWEPEEEG